MLVGRSGVFESSGDWIDDITEALKDPAVKNSIQRNVSLKNIELVSRDSQKAVFQNEMKLIGEKGDRAVLEPASQADMNFDIDES